MKCLIVEDLLSNQLKFAKVAKAVGLDFWCVSSVSDASYLIRSHDFDIILLDLTVEDGNTLPLADYLHATGSPSTIIVIVDTEEFPRGEVSAISPRIDYVLRRPISLPNLEALVRYACRKPDRNA